MMSALACDSRYGSSAANRSRSSSMARPISLAGGRSSTNSMTPLATCQQSDFPLYSFMPVFLGFAFGIHLFDFPVVPRRYRVAFELAIGCEQAVFNRKRIPHGMKRPNLAVVRKCSVQPLDLRIDFAVRR